MFVYAKNMLQLSKPAFAYNLHRKRNLYLRTTPSPKAKFYQRFLKSSGVLGFVFVRLGLRVKQTNTQTKTNRKETEVASKFLFSDFI